MSVRIVCRGVRGWIVVLTAAMWLMSGASAADSPHDAARNQPDVIRSAASGAWSLPATWEGGQVPAAGARVLIQRGHRVVYDVKSEETIRVMRIAGTLSFAHDRDTRLNAGLIRIEDGDDVSEEGFDCLDHVAESAKSANRTGGSMRNTG